MKKIICIGGSDSSGGAGIELDERILSNLGGYFSIISTSQTFQTHKDFISAKHIPPSILTQRLSECFVEGPCIVKIGMIGTFENLKVLFEFLSKREDFIILDPIFYSSSGGELFQKEGVTFLKEKFFPKVNLLTPNLNELKFLLGENPDPHHFFGFGIENILLKGGHFQNDTNLIDDYFFSPNEDFIISTSKINREYATRGTGCALASSIAFGLSTGLSLKDAIIFAKINFSRIFRKARFEEEVFILDPILPFEEDIIPADMPFIKNANGNFPKLDIFGRGVYPIVDRAKSLMNLKGVKIAQLRVKDLKGSDLENEIKLGIKVANSLGIKLFINDYFEIARKYHAFGIHLGQEDLLKYEKRELIESGIRLGISTHSFFELAFALGFSPSYIAFGPIYFTNLKAMSFAPQGIEKLKLMRKLVEIPFVAIGGITLEVLPEILTGKPEFISVVSDISKNPDPANRVKEWIGALE